MRCWSCWRLSWREKVSSTLLRDCFNVLPKVVRLLYSSGTTTSAYALAAPGVETLVLGCSVLQPQRVVPLISPKPQDLTEP